MSNARSVPTFFETPEAFRTWLAAHASSATEIIVGFYKRGSGHSSITWPQAVDEALCVGWVDGVRQSLDDKRYQIRFSPRKPSSTWSAVNIKRVAALKCEGRMTEAGLAAFERRTETKSKTYSYEQDRTAEFTPAELRAFKKHKAGWAFFESLPPSYRKKVVWWIVSAKQPATREKRLAQLIEVCEKGKRL